MSLFYYLPLRRKLIVSFLPIAALCLGVAGVTFRAISSIAAAGTEIGAELVPSLMALAQMNEGVSDMRRVDQGMIIAKLSKDDALYAKRAEEYRTCLLYTSP